MCHLSLLLPADGVQRLATSPPVRPRRNPGVQPMQPVPHRATCGRTGMEAAGSTPPYHATTCDHGAGPHGNRYSRAETQRRRFETKAEEQGRGVIANPARLERNAAAGQSKETPKKNVSSPQAYACPFCHVTVYTSLETGKVHVSGHRGKEFRVRNGRVIRAFTHACPKCGTEVSSTIARGRLRLSHQQPHGRTCPITRWTVK